MRHKAYSVPHSIAPSPPTFVKPSWPHLLYWKLPRLLTDANHTPITSPCKEGVEHHLRCTKLHSALTSELEHHQYKRGLVIVYKGRGFWGFGIMMVHVYLLQLFCRDLRRFCYLQLFDSMIDQVFGYANGMAFKADPAELMRYGASTSVYNVSSSMRLLPLRHNFVRLLQHDDAALIRVEFDRLPALQPYSAMPVLPWDHPFVQGQVRELMDPCFQRFFSAPRFPCGDDGVAPSAARPHVYHLRTGYADVRDSDVAVPNRTLTLIWLHAACPRLLEHSVLKPPVRLISDSPGIVDLFHSTKAGTYDALRQRNRGGDITRDGARSSRTFNSQGASLQKASLDAAHDLACASRSTAALFASAHSSFPRILFGRLLCDARAERHDDGDSGGLCPLADHVFLREMYSVVLRTSNRTKYMSYEDLQPRLIPSHPCKTLSRAECHASYVAALS